MLKLLEPAIGADGWTGQIDLLPYFFRLTIDSATEFLFGESVNSQLRLVPGNQSTKLGQSEESFSLAFDAGQRALATRTRFMNKYWLYDSLEFRSACKVVHDFVDHFVQRALSRVSEKEKRDTDKERYVFLEALATQTQDPSILRFELLHLLLAGRDTTASHLGWGKGFPFLLYEQLLRETSIDSPQSSTTSPATLSATRNCAMLSWPTLERTRNQRK